MIKFLRLLNLQPIEGRKKTKTVAANGSRNRNQRSLDGRFGIDVVPVKLIVGWKEKKID